MSRVRLSLEAPRASSVRTRRSMETELSPASIFAARDWLDLMALATSDCVMLRRSLWFRRLSASLSLISMYASSWEERPRNSFALPTVHPLASRRLLFLLRIVIFRFGVTEKADRERKDLFEQIRSALMTAKTIAQLQTAWSLTNGKKTRIGEELHTQLQTIKDSRKAELLEVA